jgi:hypothetical protein
VFDSVSNNGKELLWEEEDDDWGVREEDGRRGG